MAVLKLQDNIITVFNWHCWKNIPFPHIPLSALNTLHLWSPFSVVSITFSRFYRAALYATRSFLWTSVRLSVCLSDRLSNAWIVTKRKHLAKSSIMTNRKSPTSFPMSLRWTAYVAPNPPKGALQMTIFFVFRMKNWLRSKKVCCKVSLCENCQRQKL